MTPERFEQLIDTFGSNILSWPEQERSEATDLLRSSARAKAVYASAKELEELLNDGIELTPSATLLRRVAEVPLRESPKITHSARGDLLASFWRPVASVLGFAALGVFLGWVVPEPGEALELDTLELSELAFSSEVVEELE